MKSKRDSPLYRNFISYLGLIIIFINLCLIIATLVWKYSIKTSSPYIGIFSFLIFPFFILIGFLIFLFGMYKESQRRKKYHLEAVPYPVVDLNLPEHRKKFLKVTLFGSFILIILGFAGYNGFLFTESVTFCGRICHKVMEPEYQAYLKSPHARVTCVDCHVGKGATWYAKSKISGVKQIFATIFNTYEKPIPTPIKNLRPARETCEECHWPQKFYGNQLMELYHFRYDEKNTPEQINLIIKTGGGSRIEKNVGIHWHMLLQNKVYFKPYDERYQIIPYVKTVKENGEVKIYINKELNLKKEDLEKLPLREMDCMDCHNRPTHIFDPPEWAVDTAIAGGHISRDLPFVKKISVDLLTKDYKTKEEAFQKIEEEFLNFYKKNYPELFQKEKEKINNAILVLKEIFKSNVFPEMNVNWNTYPNNIGHRNWPGCFRCHDGKHISEDGKILTTECKICHTIPKRGPQVSVEEEFPEMPLPWHPMELKGKHNEILCNKCHEAGKRAPIDCAECHRLNENDEMISMGCDICHLEEGRALPQKDCGNCHKKLKGLHLKGAHPDLSCKECHKQHIWKINGEKGCYDCHEGYEEHSKKMNCFSCHSFKD